MKNENIISENDEDILYDGTEEEIKKIRCNACGHELEYSYSDETGTFKIVCNNCFRFISYYQSPKPNCVK